MNLALMYFSTGSCFLLSFLLFFHPLGQNSKANRWLAFFVFLMGSSFLGISFGEATGYLILFINAIQFLMAPSLLLATLFFVNPTKTLKPKDWLHFLPFLFYVLIECFLFSGDGNLIRQKLFSIGYTDFLVRDLLPIQLLVYISLSYFALVRHQKNLRLITASVKEINLNWLRYFLLILALVLIFWINDALIGMSFMLKVMPIAYAISAFFLAYFSIRQRTIFAFGKKELQDISELFEAPQNNSKKSARLEKNEVERLSEQLNRLITEEKIFLDNELSLPVLADKLKISIHDASYLINEVTGNNFYSYINSKRVEEAQRLLLSDKSEELNMLGIAFASGFNSKTTFNTAFKKYTGLSPTQYLKQNSQR
ncbi:AraC-like DNA-binding protein [Flavobacterium sp. 28YEA47A]|uniref:helix-turn-helix domain-containing protein n=1 Tax=Flavobacterium sp. 28YEA47A TaxID=3156276 RepID=UPI003519ACAD